MSESLTTQDGVDEVEVILGKLDVALEGHTFASIVTSCLSVVASITLDETDVEGETKQLETRAFRASVGLALINLATVIQDANESDAPRIQLLN